MMTISNDVPASYEQVEALQDQVRTMQLKIDEQQLKLDEINSHLKPKESDEMTWEKFMQILADQLGTMSQVYLGKFRKLRNNYTDVYKLTLKDEMTSFVNKAKAPSTRNGWISALKFA